jgi:hypothetical protein
MQTIYELKEQAVTDAPLLIFDCTLADGHIERWSTHRIQLGNLLYTARVLQHNVFEMQIASDQGIDGIPRISILLANADGHCSELERSTGWKGARLTVGFLFYDLRNHAPASDVTVIFQGFCNPPDEIREGTFRITAINRMNLQRLLLPQVRIQRRCPWEFPTNQQQRIEAIDGGVNGKYSRYYRCGYSAGEAGGSGNLNKDMPFTSCGYTRSDCQQRGMFLHFGGIEFVPPSIAVRTYGDRTTHASAVAVNEARYNDFVPLIYGTGWYAPPIVFGRNDGNLTRLEVLLGLGEIQGVLKVLVNDVEIPVGVAGTNMTGTGWYNVITLGTREGACDPNFTDESGNPAGDPYGSMAYLSVVVPNRLNDGTSLPRVKVLVQGLKLPIYGTDGVQIGDRFTNNPAWILLDILRRMGWGASEIDIPSFAKAAEYCDEEIPALDIYGNPITLPRFQCNLILQERKSAGDVVRGVRNAGRLLLSYGANGALQLKVENTIALQQPSKPEWSNSTSQIQGGWPSYEFGDGSNGFSGILRKDNGEPTFRVFSRSIANTPNRLSVEFQDALNEYQHDSASIVDPDDVARSGQEVAAPLAALGLPNYDQASRILKLNLDKSLRGNVYVEFQTSVKALGIRLGDLISITYLKEGFNRQLFRVLKIAPGVNHRITTITAQIHDDAWYSDTNGQVLSASNGRRTANATLGPPKPLLGTVIDENGDIQFGIAESTSTQSDGTLSTTLTISFALPPSPTSPGPRIPLLSLSPTIEPGGNLQGPQTLYYALSGCDGEGQEGELSFIVAAFVQEGGSQVRLTGLSFSPETATFHVYRGSSPPQLFRIASNQPLSNEFLDSGLSKQLVPPPDPNFDHANFYWRLELLPEVSATIYSANTLGSSSLEMPSNGYRGMIVRITRGKGAGQERSILSNTVDTLAVSPGWTVEPDSTSVFVVAENGWKFGAAAMTSPIQFAVPSRGGETIHINGRAANASDVESSFELSTVTRWQIGGDGITDHGAPPIPSFGIAPRASRGTIELTGVSFPTLDNTHTISSATLTLYYWDELQELPPTVLAAPLQPNDLILSLASSTAPAAGTYLQIAGEVLRIDDVLQAGMQYRVTRAMHGTAPTNQPAGTPAYVLSVKTVIVPFPRNFFGSPYAGNWSYPIALPDARVASAELFVTNSIGSSPVGSIHLTNNDDQGLRTFSGGQYSIQVSGFLAIDQAAAPPLIIDSPHAVRDIYAVLGTPADSPVTIQLTLNGAPYCTLTFPAGATSSNAINGNSLPPLPAGASLNVSILTVGTALPGADLTILIRL